MNTFGRQPRMNKWEGQPESSFSHWLVAFSDLNQPIQVGFAPAVAGSAVEGEAVVLFSKFFNCPHADH